jgi:hypothetical protein
MRQTNPALIAMTLVALVLPGCAASPWAAKKPATNENAAPAQPAAANNAPPASAPASKGQVDQKALQQVMAEVQQLGALDKAAQDKLMEDLKQVDASLWPLVVQQYRAAAAYRRQAEQRDAVAAAGTSVPASDNANRLPPPAAATTPSAPPPTNAPATRPPADMHQTNRPADANDRVVAASFNQVAPGQSQTHLQAALTAMEAEAAAASKSPDSIARFAQLRMLSLLAGRRDEAIKPLPTGTPAEQDFWSKQMFGLATWLDTARNPDLSRRSAETKRILDEASGRLAEAAPLVVRNLAFCTEIQSYGCMKTFRSNEFMPDQEVLLYAEVENFGSESTPKGYHTKMRTSYQIFDSRGQRVAEHDFAVAEEYCQNPRRDFFIGYRLRLPSRIYPGKHTLQLTIEDQKSQKIGQAPIELTIRDATAERKRS